MTAPYYYILEGKTPVEEPDVLKWASWMAEGDRHVNYTELPNEVNVSTVFLGIDHSFLSDRPILFETMIFGGEHDEFQERYSTWEQAEAGHQKAIELVFQ